MSQEQNNATTTTTTEDAVKPEEEAFNSDPNSVEIKVADQEGREILFRTKKDSPIEKMMNAYSKRQGVDKNSFRFLFDGQRIEASQTPRDLGMENGDMIDVVLSQTGGHYFVLNNCDINGYSALFLQ